MSTFIDANIFLATLDRDEETSKAAEAVLDDVSDGVTSTAVLLEVLSVATRRFRLDYSDATAAVKDILARRVGRRVGRAPVRGRHGRADEQAGRKRRRRCARCIGHPEGL